MVDVEKLVAHWQRGAEEDSAVGRELVALGRTRHGMFFAHLALEKALKAHVCRRTRDLAPRTHNLVRLAEMSGLDCGQDRIDFLAEMNAFCMEGRYPDLPMAALSQAEAGRYSARSEEVLQWLINQL